MYLTRSLPSAKLKLGGFPELKLRFKLTHHESNLATLDLICLFI
jgi:hypothetical protein